MSSQPDNPSREVDNTLLYHYIQLAYNYLSEVSEEPLQGDTLQFKKQLYQQRLLVLLKNHTQKLNLQITSRNDLQDWFRDLRRQLDENIHQGQFAEFHIGNRNGSGFLENSSRYQAAYERDKADIADFGVEAYATYLPIHFFFGKRQFETDWGIYISEDGVLRLAANLKSVAEQIIDIENFERNVFIELAYQVLLRHELEHFKIESFALNAEMICGRALYVPYLMNVYVTVYNTEDCLEEALANATVLYSRAISNRIRDQFPSGTDGRRGITEYWRYIVDEAFFRYQPAGYRNFHLSEGPHLTIERKGIGVRQAAMNYLCNQILSGKCKPESDIPLFAYPPDNYFLRAEHLVPIHIVKSLNEDDSFIHVATLKRKEWEKFLKRLHYQPTDRGRGDHVVWSGPLGDVTIDYKGGHLDLGSFKSTLKQLGLKIRDYQHYRHSKRLPRELEERLNLATSGRVLTQA